MIELLEAARRYAVRGWPVFPCRPRLKTPATTHGLNDATTDLGLITAWWDQWPEANIGITTGARSRLVVLDVDGEHGLESLRKLEAAHEPLPRTATVATPRGGMHQYFEHPGATVRNSAGKLGAGLDVRGDGGYVLAPPSAFAGRRYAPTARAPLAPLPAWLLNRLADRTTARKPTPASEWVALVRDGLPTGERNHGLARLVGHLLHRDIDAHLAAELAHLVNSRCRPPLPSDEVDRILTSIAGREIRRRRNARS